MTVNDIYAEIQYCEKQIENLRYEIQTLRRDQDRLDLLAENVHNLQTRFIQSRDNTVSKLASKSQFRLAKCGKSYLRGMKDFLNGSEFHNTRDALDKDIGIIRNKQFEFEEHIRENQARINSLAQKISWLRVQADELMAAEQAEE